MKAIVIHENGESEQLRYEDYATPEISDSEMLVKVEVAGINFIDVYFRKGVYPTENFPYVPGEDGCGVVEKIGKDVQGFQVGDRVAFAHANSGSYAEYALVGANSAVKVPNGISSKVAAGLMVQGLTAHYLSHSTFPIQAGDTALVHAAAGGVGLLLTQIAKLKGARVIGTVSTPEKAEKAKQAGADQIVMYTEQNFQKEVMAWTEGKGASVVYDSVGKDTFEDSLKSLQVRGMLVTYGQSSGVIPPFDVLLLNRLGSLYVTRPTLKNYISAPGEIQQRANDLFAYIEAGKLNVEIGQSYPLEQAKVAHDDLENRRTTGKSVLEV